METIVSIIGWIIFGMIIGVIARLLIPGRQTMSLMTTMVLGIIGSLAGGLISWVFTGGPNEPFHPAGWIMSVIGAIIVLLIYGAMTGSPRRV